MMVLVVLAVFVSVLTASSFLTHYMNQEMDLLRSQIIAQDMETIRQQFSVINEMLIGISTDADTTLLTSPRGDDQSRAPAIIGTRKRLGSIISSAEGVQMAFLFLPQHDLIIGQGGSVSPAETFLRYRITDSWESAQMLLKQINEVQSITYFPCPEALMGKHRVFEVFPLPLGALQPKGYLCAVIEPKLEKSNEELTDIRFLTNSQSILLSAGLSPDYSLTDADIRAIFVDDLESITLNATVYERKCQSFSLGNLQYIYLTSNATLNRHMQFTWLTAGFIALVISILAVLVALRCSRKLYQPVGSLINALVAQGRIIPGKKPDELAAVGQLVDEVLMDNEKLARSLDALSPMLDDMVFHHVLEGDDGPECAEWLNAFEGKSLQLMKVRLSHSHLVLTQHQNESFNRLLRLIAGHLHGTLSEHFIVRAALGYKSIYLVFSHSMPPENFRLRIAALMEQVQEQIIAHYGLPLLYTVSLGFPRSLDTKENAAMMREMNEQCQTAFDQCFLQSQSSGGAWYRLSPIAACDEAEMSLVPIRLENRMLALIQVGRAMECWNIFLSFLNERICIDGITCSAIKKLMTGGLDILYKALASCNRDGRTLLGNYPATSALLARADAFDEAVAYLQGLFEKVEHLFQNEMNGLPVSLEELEAYIRSNWQSDISLSDAAAHWELSEGYFSKIVKTLTGKSFPDYLSHQRVERARELMMDNDLTIAEISERAGFNNYKTFTRCFRKYYDTSPSEYRKSMQMGQ